MPYEKMMIPEAAGYRLIGWIYRERGKDVDDDD